MLVFRCEESCGWCCGCCGVLQCFLGCQRRFGADLCVFLRVVGFRWVRAQIVSILYWQSMCGMRCKIAQVQRFCVATTLFSHLCVFVVDVCAQSPFVRRHFSLPWIVFAGLHGKLKRLRHVPRSLGLHYRRRERCGHQDGFLLVSSSEWRAQIWRVFEEEVCRGCRCSTCHYGATFRFNKNYRKR